MGQITPAILKGDDEDIISSLECLNSARIDCVSSPEYQLGKLVEIAKSRFAGEGIRAFPRLIRLLKIRMIGADTGFDYPLWFPSYLNKPVDSMIVYTCITNGYDNLKNPISARSNCRWVCFTDESATATSWELKPVSNDFQGSDINRFYKMHPREAGADNRFFVYVDGSMRVVSPLDGFCRIAAESPTGLAFHRHSLRDCVYAEGRVLEAIGRGVPEKIHSQLKRYQQEGFPEHFGLLEATVFAVDLANPTSTMILDAWWNEYLASGSRRDQLALPYVLWRHGFSAGDIGNLGSNVFKNPKLAYSTHEGRR